MNSLAQYSILFVVLFLAATSEVFACACQETYSIPQAVERSSMVFVGTVESVVDDPKRDGIWYPRVAIEKSFKGVDAGTNTVDLLALSASPDCTYMLGKGYVGTKWLFYIEQPERKEFYDAKTKSYELSEEKILWASTCSGTRLIAQAADDLDLLKYPEKYRGKTRFSGTIRYNPQGQDVKLRLFGKDKTYLPKLHPSGYFEFFDMPPGRYVFEIELPPGFAAKSLFSGGLLRLDKFQGPNGVQHREELFIHSDKHTGMDLHLYRIADRP